MLAPLKDRSILEGCGTPEPVMPAEMVAELVEEMQDLRRALRESRASLRLNAWKSARQTALLHAEISRLKALCSCYEGRLEQYESGVAVIALGQALMRLAGERDSLAQQLGLSKLDLD